jgi:putative spermidine/putrescine transport system permease protein
MTDTSTRVPVIHRVSTYLHRHPRVRLMLLLALPVLWLVVIYGGSLLSLLLQSFYRLNTFSGVLERVVSLDTWKTLFTDANNAVILRTVGMAAAVTTWRATQPGEPRPSSSCWS